MADSSTNTTIKDADWMRQSFMLPVRAIDEEDVYRRYYTTARWKYTDTTLGGNLAINPLPQFTEYADRPVKNLFNVGTGMGRFYSEIIDDNQQRVHLRFGVPEYNSLTGFMGSFYDPNLSYLVRKGRERGLAGKAGYLVGSVLALPVQIANSVMGIARYWLGTPASKFAYLKPTMPLYWDAYQSMLNTLSANMGISLAPPMDRYANLGNVTGVMDIKNVPSQQADIVRRMLPNNWVSGFTDENPGGINIYAVSKRAQMYSDAFNRAMKDMLDSAESTTEMGGLLRAVDDGTTVIDLTDYNSSARTLQQYLTDYFESDLGAPGRESGSTTSTTSSFSTSGTTPTTVAAAVKVGEAAQPSEQAEQAASWRGGQSTLDGDPQFGSGVSRVFNHLLAEAREGASWVTYRVDHIGTISESISTSASESGLASAINSASSAKKKLQYNLAGGNIGDGALASFVEGVVGGVTDFVAGVADGVGIGGLGVLIGNGLADIQKDWESTVVNLPKADFQIQLRSWSGDKISQFQNIWVPLCGLLTGALPRSTGPSSYDKPFMCEMFYQGRQQVRYGVIDSLNITRGVGNVGWSQDHRALGVDVSFSVLDLSSIMHMPIAQGLMDQVNFLNPLATVDNALRYLFGDDTTYSDYLATISAVSLADRTYGWETLSRRWKNAALDFDSYFSVAHFASAAFNTLPGRLIQALSNQSSRN